MIRPVLATFSIALPSLSIAQRIVVASDSVAQDALRKTMIVQAAPPGVKVHVVTRDQLIKINNDPRFGGCRMMVLFETPQDALYCVERGVDMPKICLGSMAHSLGKVVATRALAMDAEDVRVVEEAGVKTHVYAYVVPSESSTTVEEVLKKAQKNYCNFKKEKKGEIKL